MVRTQMLIRRKVDRVFEAFVDPVISRKIWFTKGSGPLEVAKALDSMQGFALLPAGLEAFREHGIDLCLVADCHPDGHP